MQARTTQVACNKSTRGSELQYLFLANSPGDWEDFSLRVSDSDYETNETILNALIGTLVKYNNVGQIAPYLASSYNISNDGKLWRYKLRSDLFCEDNSPITAERYYKVLLRQLKVYSKKGYPIDFNLLIGFEDYKNGNSADIKGLRYSDNELIFEFTKRPEDLNEILRMPYFGFWCQNEEIKSDFSNFISSGPYKVNMTSTPRKLILEKRENWFSINSESFNSIVFTFKNVGDFNDEDLFIKSQVIVDTSTRFEIDNLILNKQKKFQSTPSRVANLILSPTYNGIFSKVENRKFVLNKIREYNKTTNNDYSNTNFFYNNNKSAVIESEIKRLDLMDYKSVTLAFGGDKNKRFNEIEKSLKRILNEENILLKLENKSDQDSNWWASIQDNTMYDFRLGSVAAGGRIRNFVVKMMFCTNLGVRYPDPSGKICSLVDEYDRLEKPIDETYIRRFNQALYDDACVIPLYHFGKKWIISSTIDEETFTPTIEIPRFEDIKIKK